MYDINALRKEEFPLSENIAYLNHASVSPLPSRTRQKMIWSVQRLAEHPHHHFQVDNTQAMVPQFKAQFAAHFNAQPTEMAYMTSTSAAINTFAQSLRFGAGDSIAFCAIEFPSNAYPWMSLADDGVEIRRVEPVNGGLTLDALKNHVDDSTRLVAVSALQFFTGHRADLAAIGQFCHENNILFFVDAIQCAGHFSIDVRALHIDALAAGGGPDVCSGNGHRKDETAHDWRECHAKLLALAEL